MASPTPRWFFYPKYLISVMAKSTTLHICNNCDAQFSKWSGQCAECGKWGTLEQSSSTEAPQALQQRKQALDNVSAVKPTAFSDLTTAQVKRLTSGIEEFDRVLGGGIVPGSLVLLGGDPGVGKSTLVAQVAAGIGQTVLYVSGEESASQIKLRLDRLELNQSQLHFLAEEHVEVICKTITEQQPGLVIIDSIQTVASSAVDSEPGSVNQIKAATVRFLETAKTSGIPIMIIGHVTKGGELGGPKTLEHIVDAVLYLEGDRHHQFRLLRSAKNRFGSTNEIGIFQMQEQGLSQVANPSETFIAERSDSAGSCMTATIEGNRIFLVEVQALVTKTSFGFPQRKASGFDLNRLNVLLAVLQRRAGLPFDSHDVYLNIVGGVRFSEPAIDAAVCLALVSALYDQPLANTIIAWGEVGLGGELRSASRGDDRAKEAKRFGLTSPISASTVKNIRDTIAAAGLNKK